MNGACLPSASADRPPARVCEERGRREVLRCKAKVLEARLAWLAAELDTSHCWTWIRSHPRTDFTPKSTGLQRLHAEWHRRQDRHPVLHPPLNDRLPLRSRGDGPVRRVVTVGRRRRPVGSRNSLPSIVEAVDDLFFLQGALKARGRVWRGHGGAGLGGRLWCHAEGSVVIFWGGRKSTSCFTG